MLIATPPEFSFPLCLDFLRRSPRELLHKTTEHSVVKALKAEDTVVVFEVTSDGKALTIGFITKEPEVNIQQTVATYVREWFDLDTELKPFYALALKDKLLRDAAARYYGYRIVGQPDLFESLVWAVLGQQINR